MRQYVDMFQIGARNMQNFELLKQVGKTGMPVLLKRGLSATIEEWLMAAEYLLAHGTDDVILCERGIRTFETYTRNTLDLSAIPVVKKLSHLPVIVDPSHATGIREKVPPMGLAAIAAGADGLTVEVHPEPAKALSDGPQSLYPDQFEKLMRDIEALSAVVGKEVAKIPTAKSAPGKIISVSVDRPGRGDRRDPAGEAPREKPPVAFQGETGAYSETALRGFFHFDVESLACKSFDDVFASVLEGRAEYGIIPLENSLAGSIHENYDLLLRYPDIKVVGETKLRIIHSLIGIPGSEISGIKKIFSHPQGLAQCRRFLEEHPDMEKAPFYDTAGSVAFIAAEKRGDYGAIANKEAAGIYGMRVLKEGIETNPHNYTRFAVIARAEKEAGENPNKAIIIFSAPDRPGSLFACMKALSEKNLNLTKLESRPIEGKPWQYLFYMDVDVPEDTGLFTRAMEELTAISEEAPRVLGMYRV
jgi:prephenate dehydratase